MNEVYAIVSVGFLLGWCFMRLAGLILSPRKAAIVGLALGVLLVLVGRGQQPISLIVALFVPVALSLPVIIAQDAMTAFGYRPRVWPNWEIATLFLIYSTFLAASLGVFAFDPYRLGYQPTAVIVLTLSLVLYGWLRRDFAIAGIALAGQGFWIFGIGSSNYFDQILHVLLAPILIAMLVKRIFRARTWFRGRR